MWEFAADSRTFTITPSKYSSVLFARCTLTGLKIYSIAPEVCLIKWLVSVRLRMGNAAVIHGKGPQA